jgi:hypothetical protein
MNNCVVCHSHCYHEITEKITMLTNQCDMMLNKIKASLNSKKYEKKIILLFQQINNNSKEIKNELTEDDLNNMYEKLFQLKQQVCDLLSKFLNGQIEQEMVKFFKK